MSPTGKTAPGAWTPAEGSVKDILKRYPRPLDALAAGEIPGIVLRKAFDPDDCVALIKWLYDRGLAYDPGPAPDGGGPVYVGPHFAAHSADPEKFFADAADTHELFSTLFEGHDDPVKKFYEMLSRLVPDKRVMTAREPDERLYGPAVFRILPSRQGTRPAL